MRLMTRSIFKVESGGRNRAADTGGVAGMLDAGPAARTMGDTRRVALRRIAGDRQDVKGMDRPLGDGRHSEKHRDASQNEFLHGGLSFLLVETEEPRHAPGSSPVL